MKIKNLEGLVKNVGELFRYSVFYWLILGTFHHSFIFTDILVKRTQILPVMSRTLSEITTKLEVLNQRIDALDRTTASKEEDVCTRVMAFIPIQSEAVLDAFEEELKKDANFRQEFVSISIIFQELKIWPADMKISIKEDVVFLLYAHFNDKISTKI